MPWYAFECNYWQIAVDAVNRRDAQQHIKHAAPGAKFRGEFTPPPMSSTNPSLRKITPGRNYTKGVVEVSQPPAYDPASQLNAHQLCHRRDVSRECIRCFARDQLARSRVIIHLHTYQRKRHRAILKTLLL